MGKFNFQNLLLVVSIEKKFYLKIKLLKFLKFLIEIKMAKYLYKNLR